MIGLKNSLPLDEMWIRYGQPYVSERIWNSKLLDTQDTSNSPDLLQHSLWSLGDIQGRVT